MNYENKPVIVYAVAGQGRGHVAKSHAIAQKLQDHYRVLFFAGGEAYDYLVKANQPVTQIPTPRFSFKNNAIHLPGTIKRNVGLVMGLRKTLAEIRSQLSALQPVLIISDFESLVPRAGKKLGIPVLQISHQVVLLGCETPIPLKQRYNWFKAWFITRIMISHFDRALGVSFFQSPVKKRFRKNVVILPPALRETLTREGRTVRNEKEHVLVYLSCNAFGWVVDRLAMHTTQKFIVYGLDQENLSAHANVIHRPISPDGFMKDLLQAKAVITNGGHNFISEAAWLGIPIMSFWVAGQFEQWLNAYQVESMGLGRMVEDLRQTDAILADFLNTLPSFTKPPGSQIQDGGKLLHDAILAFFKESAQGAPGRLKPEEAAT